MERNSSLGSKELFAIIMLATINLFLCADQNLMAPNLTQIARDFGFNDIERDVKLAGQISLVFYMIGATVTLCVGYFTDLISRKKLFMTVILVGAIPCFLSGFVRNYEQLLVLRALTGIGIGGVTPITFSLIGDYFSRKNRSMAAAWIVLVQGLGVAVGQMVAGFIGPEYGWRLPFIIVASPLFLIAIIFWIGMEDPPRGKSEESLKELIERGSVYTGKINFSLYRDIFRIKSNVLILLQGLPWCLPWGVLYIFCNDFYAQDKGFSVEMATIIVMTGGAAALVGTYVGGLIGNKIYNRKPRFLPLFTGCAAFLSVIPLLYLINYPSQLGVENPSLAVPLVLAFLTGFIAGFPLPNVRAMTLNVNSPETRGSIMSIANLTDSLGMGFGPAIISLFIVAFGRIGAFNISALFWILSGILQIAMVFTFHRDEQALNALLKEKAKTMSG